MRDIQNETFETNLRGMMHFFRLTKSDFMKQKLVFFRPNLEM